MPNVAFSNRHKLKEKVSVPDFTINRATVLLDICRIVHYNIFCAIKSTLGEVPKWSKGLAWKAGRSGNRREGSNPSFSVFTHYSLVDWDNVSREAVRKGSQPSANSNT